MGVRSEATTARRSDAGIPDRRAPAHRGPLRLKEVRCYGALNAGPGGEGAVYISARRTTASRGPRAIGLLDARPLRRRDAGNLVAVGLCDRRARPLARLPNDDRADDPMRRAEGVAARILAAPPPARRCRRLQRRPPRSRTQYPRPDEARRGRRPRRAAASAPHKPAPRRAGAGCARPAAGRRRAPAPPRRRDARLSRPDAGGRRAAAPAPPRARRPTPRPTPSPSPGPRPCRSGERPRRPRLARPSGRARRRTVLRLVERDVLGVEHLARAEQRLRVRVVGEVSCCFSRSASSCS